MTGDIHALSGAYAVDGVDEFERAQFERHLARCATCRTEVASLREAAAQLADVSATSAPATLRARVLADIATVRPLPPVLAQADSGRHASRRRFPALVAAAAALVVIGGVGASAWHPWSDTTVSDSPSASAAVTNVLQASDRRSVTHHVKDGTATITVSKGLDAAVVQTSGLTAPPGKVYELWLIHGDHFVPAGLVSSGGDMTAVLQGHPRTATAAGITIEPPGGSQQPTPGATVATFSFVSA